MEDINVINKRNNRLIHLFSYYGMDVDLFNIHKPKIILGKYLLPIQVVNFDVYFYDKFEGELKFKLKLNENQIFPPKNQIMDWLKESKSRRFYSLKLPNHNLYIKSFDYLEVTFTNRDKYLFLDRSKALEVVIRFKDQFQLCIE